MYMQILNASYHCMLAYASVWIDCIADSLFYYLA